VRVVKTISTTLALVATLWACGDDGGVADSGAPDGAIDSAVISDGAPVDGEAPDASVDAPITDAGASGWRTEPMLPVDLQEITAITRGDGRIWVIGGFEGTGDVPTVRIFDPVSAEWSEGPALPAARHHTHVAEVDGDLYVLGGMETIGFSLVDTAWVLPSGEMTWSPIRSLPEERGAGFAGAVGGIIYLVGGQGRGGSLASEVLTYDPAMDAWSMGAAIPSPREHLAGFVHDDEIWVVGGRELSLSTNTDVVEIYDPAGDSWRDGPSLGLARGGFAAAVLDGVAYVVGGEQPDRALHEAESLTLPDGTWTPIDRVPTPRHGHAMAASAGRVYVIGGADMPIFAAVDAVESFAP
jgi:non-specific serine/threonine protein kinase